ncbi:DUF6913 domain-containing protein [Marinoscillum sp. MHG1-6]|uniref:DUF6913 domain-containing protein n=1 Tax=Marinoscillum sp. MHG1-6 TaxID=2959627 RepID=UPI002157BDF4|nr:hypothetical protein [Marinoscillum sp. MHG1-6]
MLKQYVINYKTQRQEKRRDHSNHTSFAKAKKIGLLFTELPQTDIENIQKIISDLNAEGKEISTLAFCKSKEKSSQEFPLFDTKDISAFGQIQSEELTSFIDDDFDFLICLDNKKNYLVQYVMAHTKAKCRVGFYKADHFHQFEMIIQGNDEGKAGSEDILRYLKMIRSND